MCLATSYYLEWRILLNSVQSSLQSRANVVPLRWYSSENSFWWTLCCMVFTCLLIWTWTVPNPEWFLGIILPTPSWWFSLCSSDSFSLRITSQLKTQEIPLKTSGTLFAQFFSLQKFHEQILANSAPQTFTFFLFNLARHLGCSGSYNCIAAWKLSLGNKLVKT